MRSSSALALTLLIYILIEVYLYFGVRSLLKSRRTSPGKLLGIFYVAWTLMSFSAILLLTFFSDYFGNILTNILIGIFIINLITKLVLLPFIIVDDIRRLGLFAKRKVQRDGSKISRSAFLQKAGLLTAGIPLTALTTGIVIGGAYRYKLHKVKINSPNLPKVFKGLKIVQISDVHSGSFYDKEAVMRGVQMVIDQKPDIVFFTGDIVNEKAEEMDGYLEVFSKISAPMGVYSILGNHDYGDYYDWPTEQARLENFKAVKDIHRKLGWYLLLDEHVVLERNGERIAVLGVENWGSGFHKIGDLSKAYKDCEAPFKILLSHDPTHWEEEVIKDYLDIDLTLSGHTHGAQMGIETHNFKWSPIQLRYKRWAGLYEKNGQQLYINRGFGFLGYPGRIGIWPEITVLELDHSV